MSRTSARYFFFCMTGALNIIFYFALLLAGIMMGALAVVIMLKAPFGIWGWVVQRYDLHLLPVGRHLVLTPDKPAAR